MTAENFSWKAVLIERFWELEPAFTLTLELSLGGKEIDYRIECLAQHDAYL